jgi:Cytochrome c7 and related cytochrome c
MRPWGRHLLLGALAATAVGGFLAATARPEAPHVPMSTVMGDGAGEVTFDHTIHAGKLGIPCLDCHAYADKSPVAGIPSGRKCMGCHKFVANDKPAVQALAQRVEAGQPLRWPRVFALPDFSYFSHRMHVKAKVACSACHGDVAAMPRVTQEQPFTMGRCLACHDERNATHECLSCHK